MKSYLANKEEMQPAWKLIELVAEKTAHPIDLSVKYQLEAIDAASGR